MHEKEKHKRLCDRKWTAVKFIDYDKSTVIEWAEAQVLAIDGAMCVVRWVERVGAYTAKVCVPIGTEEPWLQD